MKKLFKSIILFFVLSILFGEIIVRLSHVVSDIPQRKIDNNGIQKYIPNQTGYWKGGNHKWKINELGWAGDLPDSYDNLVAIIGDSFIENFMNPNECHQSIYLKKQLNNYNFIEAGRSGVSFIEAMEIANHLDSLKPIKNLIYIKDDDFYESIADIKSLNDITQVNLKSNTIILGKMRSAFLKKILYNFKLLYYFYKRFSFLKFNKTKTKKYEIAERESEKNLDKVFELLNFVKSNYTINNKILVFHPNCNENIIEKCRNIGFNVIVLNSDNDKDWTFSYDRHWTCYGHKKVAEQVSKSLIEYLLDRNKRKK